MSRSLMLLLALVACKTDEPEDGSPGDDTDDTDDTGGEDWPPGAPGLDIATDPQPMCTLADEAIGVAPLWVQDDLAVALDATKESACEELSALLVDIDEPWLIDEVAFSIAHTSPEVLGKANFYPELMVENAQWIYALDEDLAYVELVDEGEAGTDDDFYTTATYQVQLSEDDGGDIVEHTIDHEIYYWYLVHPRMEDEYPYYIDGWEECSGSQCPSTPEEGMFWREFLWEGAQDECPKDRDCPVLSEYVTPDIDVLWKNNSYSTDNGAIGAIIEWEQTSITFGAGDERPIQPNRIYAVGCGNCGEWADMATAAARTVLIPSHNVGARANDHTWNEFWDEGWQQWEPVNTYVLHYTYYADEDGDYYRTLDLLDNDCDGWADEAEDTEDADGDGVTIADGDCDDTNDEVYPGATETADNSYDDDCDGVAEDPADTSDADGDGWSLLDGDCDDTTADISPDAHEVDGNSVDDDCDGIADDGVSTADVDADGYTIADGDCDDSDADINPGVDETDGNGIDDDCDGLADVDLDGDGVTIAEGDCNDEDSSIYPDAEDPKPSTNILFAITDARGDTLIGTDRTEAYGTEAYLAVTVEDDNGQPVDGAVVTVYGNWSVYGYPEYPAWAAEAITDLQGEALIDVGEANPYGLSCESQVGFDPPEGSYYGDLVELAEPGETYAFTMEVDGEMPEDLDITEVDSGGSDAAVAVSLSVDGARIRGWGAYSGSSFTTVDGEGELDWFIVDETNYALYVGGEPFEAAASGQGVEDSDEGGAEVPLDRTWYMVVANTRFVASTVLGDVAIEVSSPDGSFDTLTLDERVRIGPEEHLAVALTPDD